MLGTTAKPLVEGHDLVMFDLDGVVYVSGRAIGDVAAHISQVRESGRSVAFVTNNASRTPDQVAERLLKVGVEATGEDVVTSAQAAASLLRERYGEGARVLMLGSAGLRTALLEAGLVPVEEVDPENPVVAVTTGYGPDVRWKDIMRAAVLIREGTPYVACNADMSVPSSYGLAPGHGVLVNTLASFAGVEPTVAGKPRLPLMEETVRRVGGAAALMVGDRLDTDIEGAHSLGIPSLLVLTGVTWLKELVEAPPHQRPTYIASNTSGLFEPHPAPDTVGEQVSLRGWSGRTVDGVLTVTGEGAVDDWWRVAAAASWAYLDESGSPVDFSGLTPPGPAPVGHDE